MKEVFKLFLKFITLILLLFIVDFFIGKSFSQLLKRQNDGRYFKIQYSLDFSKEDIIIIGSSRAETNYNPTIFSKVFAISCWNSGRGGQSINYFLSIEKGILNRYSPKLIIFNLDPNCLQGPINYDKSAILRPFAKHHSTIYQLLSQKDCFEKYKLRSNTYSFNSATFDLLVSFFYKNRDGKLSEKGWKPRKGTISRFGLLTNINGDSALNHKLDSQKVVMFNEMIVFALIKNVIPIFIFSPDYFPRQKETATMIYVKEVCKKNELFVFDYTNDTTLTRKKEYFYDLEHMNNIGANKFSNLLAKKLSEIIQRPH